MTATRMTPQDQYDAFLCAKSAICMIKIRRIFPKEFDSPTDEKAMAVAREIKLAINDAIMDALIEFASLPKAKEAGR